MAIRLSRRSCATRLPKIENKGGKPDWKKLAEEGEFLETATTADGKFNKASFTKALETFLEENDVEYDEPELGKTQALGIPQNLLARLPEIYLLPAITDYSALDPRPSTPAVSEAEQQLPDERDSSDRGLAVRPVKRRRWRCITALMQSASAQML